MRVDFTAAKQFVGLLFIIAGSVKVKCFIMIIIRVAGALLVHDKTLKSIQTFHVVVVHCGVAKVVINLIMEIKSKRLGELVTNETQLIATAPTTKRIGMSVY